MEIPSRFYVLSAIYYADFHETHDKIPKFYYVHGLHIFFTYPISAKSTVARRECVCGDCV